MVPAVPKDIDSTWLKKLLVQLNTADIPEFIVCLPDAKSLVNECFLNVEAKIKNKGGKAIYGWQIWQTEHLIEAEFHAVWESGDGVVLDVTPKPFQVESIMFVRDLDTPYIGRQIDNVRINTSGNALIDDLIRVCEAKFKLENKGERAEQYNIRLTAQETDEWEFLEQMRKYISLLVAKGSTKNQQCFCGRDKYKKCHGRVLNQLLERL
ncbi:SEC-C domain-containing protein [Vibrio mimicus]